MKGSTKSGTSSRPCVPAAELVERNIEVRINRRFKRQGRSWTRNGAEHLAQPLRLQHHLAG